jgi:hypothetical protein
MFSGMDMSSGEVSPTIWSCYANFKWLSLFISLEIYCVHGLWTWKYLQSMTKLSGWLRHWIWARNMSDMVETERFFPVKGETPMTIIQRYDSLPTRISAWTHGCFTLDWKETFCFNHVRHTRSYPYHYINIKFHHLILKSFPLLLLKQIYSFAKAFSYPCKLNPILNPNIC